MNIFSRHATVRQLAAYITGELSLLRRPTLEAHVAGCSECAQKLTELERYLARVTTDSALETNSDIIEYVVRRFRPKRSRGTASIGSINRILAVLDFDSAAFAPAFGIRSATSDARQLLFFAGPYKIDLRIEAADDGWTLSGQILGDLPASGKATLHGATGTSEAPLSELSEFVVSALQSGMYRLVLSFPGTEIEIDGIRVGS